MGLSKIYRAPQTEMYRKMTAADAMGRPPSVCLWCDHPLMKGKDTWCSEECEYAYVSRARQDDVRKVLIDRDAAICEECGKHEIHYVMGSRLALQAGGGCPGVDMVRTLCEPCMLSGAGTLSSTPTTLPQIPNISPLRRAWKAAHDRHRRLRYAIGPTIVSAINWTRTLQDCKAHRRYYPLGYTRTIHHLRMVETALRWFGIVRDNTPQPGKLLKLTLRGLGDQKTSAVQWIAYFRQQEVVVFE